MNTNQIRSNSAALVMQNYEALRPDRLLDTGSGDLVIDFPEETVRDLLADIMHYCNLHDIDFDNEVRIAEDNYQSELFEDETDQ